MSLKLIKSILESRFQRVVLNGERSTWEPEVAVAIVSAWVLTPPLANHNPVTYSVPPDTEKSLWQTKSPNNSIMVHMFNSNTYTDFRTTYKHVIILSYFVRVI